MVVLIVLVLAGLAYAFRADIDVFVNDMMAQADNHEEDTAAPLSTSPSGVIQNNGQNNAQNDASEPDVAAPPVLPLDLNNPVSRVEELGGQRVLIVRGEIANPATVVQAVPDVLVDLLNANEAVIEQWRFSVSFAAIEPGATEPFSAQMSDPPSGLQQLRFSFAPPDGAAASIEADSALQP